MDDFPIKDPVLQGEIADAVNKKLWTQAYQLVLTAITAPPLPLNTSFPEYLPPTSGPVNGVELGTYIWLQAVIGVNSETGPFSALIRGWNTEQQA